jgi:hypothetical protein
MFRWMVAIALGATIGCGGSDTAEPRAASASPDDFAGTWRSVTPSLEFVRLSVDSKSSQQGVFAARLTLSGIAWEGDGRIAGDSLVLGVAPTGATATGVLVVHADAAGALRAQLRSATFAPLDLTFVRDGN